MKTVIIKGAAAIDKAIASIKNRGAKLDASIQQAGLSVLAHASEHGDTTCADRLVAAMPKGARKLALVEWMLAYGEVRKLDSKVPDEAARIKAGAVFKLDRTRTLDLEGLMKSSGTSSSLRRQSAQLSMHRRRWLMFSLVCGALWPKE